MLCKSDMFNAKREQLRRVMCVGESTESWKRTCCELIKIHLLKKSSYMVSFIIDLNTIRDFISHLDTSTRDSIHGDFDQSWSCPVVFVQ